MASPSVQTVSREPSSAPHLTLFPNMGLSFPGSLLSEHILYMVSLDLHVHSFHVREPRPRIQTPHLFSVRLPR